MRRRSFFGILVGAAIIAPAAVKGVTKKRPFFRSVNQPFFVAMQPIEPIDWGCYAIVLGYAGLRYGDYIAPSRNKLYQLRIISKLPDRVPHRAGMGYRYEVWYPTVNNEASFPAEFMAVGESWIKLWSYV